MLVAVSVTAANRWCVHRVKRLFTGQGVGISQEIDSSGSRGRLCRVSEKLAGGNCYWLELKSRWEGGLQGGSLLALLLSSDLLIFLNQRLGGKEVYC